MRSLLRLGALHMRIRLGSRRTNLKRLQILVSEVYRKSRGELDLLVLPQHPITGPIVGGYYPPERVSSHLRSYAERLQSSWGSLGFTVNALSRLASDYDVNIIAGPILERAGPRLYLSVIHIAPNGEVKAKYRKITLTKEERLRSIGAGREPTAFDIGGNKLVGVFADADIINPEIFRDFQIRGANLLVGTLMPQKEGPPFMYDPESDVLRPRGRILRSLAIARSAETGLPLLLVGGIVEGGEGGLLAYSETIVVDPDIGVIESYVRGVDDPDTYILVDVDLRRSTPRMCTSDCEQLVRRLCNTLRASRSSRRSK